MLRPNQENYNWDEFYQEPMLDSITIDQLIKSLESAKEVLGGDCMVMIYTSEASCDGIKTIHGENFHGNLVCTLSACDAKKDPSVDIKTMLYQQNEFEE